jgi:hypothetical protein
MRSYLLSSIVAVVAIGCGTKTVVVKEGNAVAPVDSSSIATKPPDDTPIASDGETAAKDPGEWGILDRQPDAEYRQVVAKVAGMASDPALSSRVSRRGLSLVNVMWEDTGRAQGSSLGPNITDLTLQVRQRSDAGFQSALMPVIRFPNFTDRTGDVPADKFFVRVGNERPGGSLRSVPLTDVLRDLKSFATLPESIKGNGNLFSPRDTHFLVSAQAVFLPIPKEGKAQFNPAVFNYQSAPESPAVLTLLVTREGTSMQVIENRGEDAASRGRGQELYFNNKGQRATFTAERKSDVEQRIAAHGGPKTEEEKTALQKGADVLFLVQIPLKHKQMGVLGGAFPSTVSGPKGGSAGAPKPSMAPAAPPMAAPADSQRSDVEQAVLGHGPNLGPYNEGRNLKLERDPKFPVRITVQFYKATSNGVVSDVDLDSIVRSIGGVYEHAEFVGSLVLPEGDPRRPTAWQKVPHEWFPW